MLTMDLLARVGVPVYAADQVPPGATCPYLTYTMTCAGFGGKGVLTVTAWARDDFAQSIDLMDRVCGLMHGGKELLTGQHGVVMLVFEQADTVQAAADRRMTGGRVRMSMRTYELSKGGGEGC